MIHNSSSYLNLLLLSWHISSIHFSLWTLCCKKTYFAKWKLFWTNLCFVLYSWIPMWLLHYMNFTYFIHFYLLLLGMEFQHKFIFICLLSYEILGVENFISCNDTKNKKSIDVLFTLNIFEWYYYNFLVHVNLSINCFTHKFYVCNCYLSDIQHQKNKWLQTYFTRFFIQWW